MFQQCSECTNMLSKTTTKCPKCSYVFVSSSCKICKKSIPSNSESCPACGDPYPFEDSDDILLDYKSLYIETVNGRKDIEPLEKSQKLKNAEQLYEMGLMDYTQFNQIRNQEVKRNDRWVGPVVIVIILITILEAIGARDWFK